MEPLYSETYLHANAPAKRKIIRGLLIVLMAFLLFIGLFSMLFLRTVIPFGVIILVDVIIYFVMPTTQIAYEYIFVDGQIDFDRILKGEKRKTMKRIDMSKVEVIAPENSHHLDAYQRLPEFDYTSGVASDKHYVAVAIGEKGTEKIYFTPDAKMLDMIGKKSPSKLKTE